MIIWLASYPKSGNTLVRSLLSAYFFSEEGHFDFKYLKSIKQFPSKQLFLKVGIKTNDENEILKNYLKAQEYINQKAPLILLKTHSSLFGINEFKFTNLDNSLGAIYIIRDPRNVVTSFSNHFNLDLNESAKKIIPISVLGESTDKKVPTYILSWKNHYESWKLFKKNKKYLLVKYEELVENPREILVKMLNFIFKLSNNKSDIDFTFYAHRSTVRFGKKGNKQVVMPVIIPPVNDYHCFIHTFDTTNPVALIEMRSTTHFFTFIINNPVMGVETASNQLLTN